MFIAAKFEEIEPPKVHEFAYITDHTYSTKEIVGMEAAVLVALDFQIVVPTQVHFLDRLERVNGCDAVHKSLAQYCLELALIDLRSLRYPPSIMVSSALWLSNEILNRKPAWPAAMVHHSRRSEAALMPCVEDLKAILDSAKSSQLQAVQRKYRLEQNFSVANLVANLVPGRLRD